MRYNRKLYRDAKRVAFEEYCDLSFRVFIDGFISLQERLSDIFLERDQQMAKFELFLCLSDVH